MKNLIASIACAFLCVGCGTLGGKSDANAVADIDGHSVLINPTLLADCKPLPEVKDGTAQDVQDYVRGSGDVMVDCATRHRALSLTVQKAFKVNPDGTPSNTK